MAKKATTRKKVSKKARPRAVMKKSADSAPPPPPLPAASHLIDVRIKALSDWRGEMLARLRAVIKQALSEVVEEWKWSVPVWSQDGIICTGETYKSSVKLTFAHGAALDDPAGLFNSSLEGATRRAIDFHEGGDVNERALKALVREAAALNSATKKAPTPRARTK